MPACSERWRDGGDHRSRHPSRIRQNPRGGRLGQSRHATRRNRPAFLAVGNGSCASRCLPGHERKRGHQKLRDASPPRRSVPKLSSVSQQIIRRTPVIQLHGVERKQMMCSLSCPTSRSGGKQKHQMRVTHSALGLHKPGNPRNGPRLRMPSSRGWPLGKRPEVASAVRNDVEGTGWEPTWRLRAGKGLSMRRFRAVPIARGFTWQQSAVDTVKAEKGELWPNVGTLN